MQANEQLIMRTQRQLDTGQASLCREFEIVSSQVFRVYIRERSTKI